MNISLAERAADHVAVGGGAVGAAAQRAARALVALLVARVAHRVVRVPARRRARARRPRAAVRAHAAALAFPAVLGHGGHDGPQAGGVVELVALLAGDGAPVGAGGVGAAHLARAAHAARPARAHARQLRETDAGAMVVCAAHNTRHEVGEVAHRATCPALDVRRAIKWYLIQMIFAERKLILKIHKAARSQYTW